MTKTFSLLHLMCFYFVYNKKNFIEFVCSLFLKCWSLCVDYVDSVDKTYAKPIFVNIKDINQIILARNLIPWSTTNILVVRLWVSLKYWDRCRMVNLSVGDEFHRKIVTAVTIMTWDKTMNPWTIPRCKTTD